MSQIGNIWLRYRLNRWFLLIVVLLLLALPLPNLLLPERNWVTNALLFSFTQMFILVTLASNWNLTGGFTGYVDFGHAVFFGIGAYGTGVMMNRAGWPFWAGLLLGAFLAAIFAVLIGSATLRLKGPYFSIAMLGTFVAVREIIRIWKPVTGGGVGLTLPPYLNRPLFYYVTLLLALLVVFLIWWIRRSEFGATLVAIREDEIGAEMRGINTTLHKISAFGIAAFSTGLVGGIWAYQNTFIDPDIVFVQQKTVEMVMVSMLGGLGTVIGPVLGASLFYWMSNEVWATLANTVFEQWQLIVQGILLIMIVLFVPEGIMGTLGDTSGTSLGRLWGRFFGAPTAEKEAA